MPFGNTKDEVIYFAAREGKFRRKVGENVETYDYVEGELFGITLEWDKGNPEKQVQPGWRLLVTLRHQEIDRATGEVARVETYKIDARHPTTFTWMFADFIHSIEVNERIRLLTWAGSENEKVSLCLIDVFRDGAWQRAPRAGGFPDDHDAKGQKAEEIIRAHKAFYERDDGTAASPAAALRREQEVYGVRVPVLEPKPGEERRLCELATNYLKFKSILDAHLRLESDQVALCHAVVNAYTGATLEPSVNLKNLTKYQARVVATFLRNAKATDVEYAIASYRAALSASAFPEEYDPFDDDGSENETRGKSD